MVQTWCSLAVLKTFFLWMFKVFSLLSIQQIDNIFQLPNTILIIEMASTVFKTDRKILSNVKIEIFLPALNYACVTWSTEEKKKIHHQWSAIDIKMSLFYFWLIRQLTLGYNLWLISNFFFSDLVGIGEHSFTCYVIFMFHGL